MDTTTVLRRKTVATTVAVALGATAGLVACSSGTGVPASDAGRVHVVVSTTQLADFARVVGGDRVDVLGLLKANVDAHEYEPSPGDMGRLAHAGVIVRNGLGLDSWMDQAVKASGTRASVIDASRGVTPHVVDGEADPHIWFDPRNAAQMVADITDALVAVDPAGRPGYEQRRDAYVAELTTLDRDIEQQLAPVTNRKVVTNHDAFGYYLDRYGLVYVGSVIPSFDTQADLSARELAKLVAAIRAAGVRAIFSETSLPAKTAEAIGREAGVRVVEGDDALYGDSLGPAGSGADTYLGMMRHNTATLVANLR